MTRALEHHHAEPGFELANLCGQRRLRNATMLGGADETAVVRNGHDIFEITQRQAAQIHRTELQIIVTTIEPDSHTAGIYQSMHTTSG
jgi:hypothetical protein